MNAAPIYCANCGRPVPAGIHFCESCGAPVASNPPPSPYPQAPAASAPMPAVPVPPPVYSAPAAPVPPPVYAAPVAYPPPQVYRRPYRSSVGGSGWCVCVIIVLALAMLTCCGLIGGAYFLYRNGQLSSLMERWLGSQVQPVMTQLGNALETQGINALETQGVISTLDILPLSTEEIFPSATPVVKPLPTVGARPSATVVAKPKATEPSPTSAVVTNFTDDFSSQNSDWTSQTTSDYTVQYENGKLAVNVITEGSAAFLVPPISFKPTTLEFSVQIAPKYQDGTLGYYEVMCDYQDANNYHTIAIDPDSNTYTFALVKDGTPNTLTSPDWKNLSTDIPSLRNSPAKIMVECTGGSMTLSVNDVYQDQVNETTFTSGKMRIGIRLWQGSPYPDGFKIFIDDLTIFRPAQ